MALLFSGTMVFAFFFLFFSLVPPPPACAPCFPPYLPHLHRFFVHAAFFLPCMCVLRVCVAQRSLPPDETIEVGACSGRDRALAGTAPSAATTIATAADGTSIGSIAPASRENADSPSFDSIVGNSAAKRTLFEHVVLPLKLDEDTRNCLFGEVSKSHAFSFLNVMIQ